jgi:hypothetical protein
MDFTTMDINTVATGSSGGIRYLQLFLQEYTAIFNEAVNPGCPKCLGEYLKKYKKHFAAMENKCSYRLYAKYENIPLEFGSPILVNNGNITDAYAEKLLGHKNGERYFELLPQRKETFTAEVAHLKKATRKARQVKKKEPGAAKDEGPAKISGKVEDL